MDTSSSSLGALLVDTKSPLALRFRALFSLKALGAEGDKAAIDAIAAGFKDDSELSSMSLPTFSVRLNSLPRFLTSRMYSKTNNNSPWYGMKQQKLLAP